MSNFDQDENNNLNTTAVVSSESQYEDLYLEEEEISGVNRPADWEGHNKPVVEKPLPGPVVELWPDHEVRYSHCLVL